MHVIVCVKSVVKRASAEMLTPDGRLIRTALASELNPYDRPALETALRLTEERGGSVTALSMGPDVARETLYEALALGVDRAVLLCDKALAGSDTLATSFALAAAINKLAPFDLVIFGARTADSDTGQVGPQTAVLLGLPLVTFTSSIKINESGLEVERRADGFRELFAVELPAALTIHPAAVMPRDAPLAGIEAAYTTGRIETLSCRDLDLEAGRIGEAGSPTRVISLRQVTIERKCELIAGTVEEQAEELVQRLVDMGLIG